MIGKTVEREKMVQKTECWEKSHSLRPVLNVLEKSDVSTSNTDSLNDILPALGCSD